MSRKKMHEIKLSPDISAHDMSYRAKSGIEWLQDGDMVKVSLFMKGRQILFVDKALATMNTFLQILSKYGKYDAPKRNNKLLITIVTPNKKQPKSPKID